MQHKIIMKAGENQMNMLITKLTMLNQHFTMLREENGKIDNPFVTNLYSLVIHGIL